MNCGKFSLNKVLDIWDTFYDGCTVYHGHCGVMVGKVGRNTSLCIASGIGQGCIPNPCLNLCKYSYAKVRKHDLGEAGFNLVDGSPQLAYSAVEFGPSGFALECGQKSHNQWWTLTILPRNVGQKWLRCMLTALGSHANQLTLQGRTVSISKCLQHVIFCQRTPGHLQSSNSLFGF